MLEARAAVLEWCMSSCLPGWRMARVFVYSRIRAFDGRGGGVPSRVLVDGAASSLSGGMFPMEWLPGGFLSFSI